MSSVGCSSLYYYVICCLFIVVSLFHLLSVHRSNPVLPLAGNISRRNALLSEICFGGWGVGGRERSFNSMLLLLLCEFYSLTNGLLRWSDSETGSHIRSAVSPYSKDFPPPPPTPFPLPPPPPVLCPSLPVILPSADHPPPHENKSDNDKVLADSTHAVLFTRLCILDEPIYTRAEKKEESGDTDQVERASERAKERKRGGGGG